METPDMSIKLRLCAEIRQLWGKGRRSRKESGCGGPARPGWISCHLISHISISSEIPIPAVSESGRAWAPQSLGLTEVHA